MQLYGEALDPVLTSLFCMQVEAMLILAEWVPRRPHATPAVGRGEEDQAAWMYVGTAIRLGYLLGIDRTGFRTETDPSAELNRKRLAW